MSPRRRSGCLDGPQLWELRIFGSVGPRDFTCLDPWDVGKTTKHPGDNHYRVVGSVFLKRPWDSGDKEAPKAACLKVARLVEA